MQRHSALEERHRQLGSLLDGDTWNGMPLPWSYRTDPHEEVIATRTRAGLYDVSALNIIKVQGRDAEAVLDSMVSIDVTRLRPGCARLASEVDEHGALIDDIVILRDGADQFRISHGSGGTPARLAALCAGKAISAIADRDVHILSLQGPRALEILQPHCAGDVEGLAYFNHIETLLFGTPIVLGRGGYSGERGYEVYCAAKDAVLLWDRILEAGQPHGVMPASWNALELTRVEGALLFFPFEMPEGDTTPWEVNLGWTIDLDKTADYIGKAALLHLRGRERFRQAGLHCDTAQAVEAGATLWAGSRQIGMVTSASYSRFLMQSLAMAHLHPAHTALGTSLEVRGSNGRCAATVVRTPFYDPLRRRTSGAV